ncbi:MAG: hypothetical protein WB439_07140 [Acidobacteriaceae bacterium]
MMSHRKPPRTSFLCLALCLCSIQIYAQRSFSPLVRNVHADKTTAVQFYWFGDMDSHWRQPMNLYVVDASDPRLHKVEFKQEPLHEAAIAYISLPEMQKIITQLSRSDDLWYETSKGGRLPDRPNDPDDEAQITVVSSHGTSVDRVRITHMCDEFASYDDLMPTKRILWQFQTMRWDNGCIIPGYHNEDVPTD